MPFELGSVTMQCGEIGPWVCKRLRGLAGARQSRPNASLHVLADKYRRQSLSPSPQRGSRQPIRKWLLIASAPQPSSPQVGDDDSTRRNSANAIIKVLFFNGLQRSSTHLECHEFMIRLRRPRINLNRVFQCNHKEFDSFVFDDLEVNGALQVANVDPTVAAFDLLLMTIRWATRNILRYNSNLHQTIHQF